MHNEKLPTKAPDPWDEIEELQKRMEKTVCGQLNLCGDGRRETPHLAGHF